MNNPPPPKPQEEFATAQAAFTKRDYQHAIFHLSYALMSKPQEPEYIALLNRIISNAREPLTLIQKDAKGGMHFSHAAVNAYIHAQHGKYEEAINQITQVINAASALQYLPWVGEWLSKPERANKINARTVMGLLFAITSKVGEYIADPTQREAIERILPTLAQLRQNNPQDGLFASVTSIVLRKMGHVDEAIEVGKAAYAITPDYMPAAFLAGAYKSKGDVKLAAETFKKALIHKPDDAYVRLDLGDILCKDGQYEAGLAYYQEALKIEPDNDWAKPHYLYYQAISSKAPHWTDELRAYTAANPNNRQAGDLLFRLTTAPFVDYLIQPSEATINILRHMAAKKGTLNDLGLNVLEAPSAMLALQLYHRENGGTQNVSVGVADIQQPDPRIPHGEVDFVLWKYDGTVPIPAVDPPGQQIAEAVAKVAARPYNLESWLAAARKLGAAATPSRLRSLLGVMVHPPPHPPEIAIWDWIQNIQVVASLSIAYIDTGWEGSARRSALFSLARGPMDWTVGTAILALTQIALEEPDIMRDVENLFSDIMGNAPRQGGVTYMPWLVINSLRLPGLDPEARKELELIRNDMGY